MSDADTEEWVTVAQAAERLGTTVPRLRRLLARPELSDCSRQEAVQTQRGTRTSMVVLVSQFPTLRQSLQKAETGESIEEQKQEHLKTFSKREAAALELALQQTQLTLAAKDQTIAVQARELATKDEVIDLLKDKIAALQDIQEQIQEQTVLVTEKTPSPIEKMVQEQEQERSVLVPEKPMLTFWDRLWGRR